eukprot:4122657-Lingulodinium_polyedra.AAC.1
MAHGARARNAFRRAEAAKRTFESVAVQHFCKRCTKMRPHARFAASTRQNAPRTHAPRAHHEM